MRSNNSSLNECQGCQRQITLFTLPLCNHEIELIPAILAINLSESSRSVHQRANPSQFLGWSKSQWRGSSTKLKRQLHVEQMTEDPNSKTQTWKSSIGHMCMSRRSSSGSSASSEDLDAVCSELASTSGERVEWSGSKTARFVPCGTKLLYLFSSVEATHDTHDTGCTRVKKTGGSYHQLLQKTMKICFGFFSWFWIKKDDTDRPNKASEINSYSSWGMSWWRLPIFQLAAFHLNNVSHQPGHFLTVSPCLSHL